MKYEIDIEDEMIDKIIAHRLKDDLEHLVFSLEQRANGNGMALFDLDKDVDVKEIKKLIKSYKAVIEYCCR